MNKISSNSVALAGEFAVLSQLALRGYDANMTLGHTKNVDILVSNPQTEKVFKLEVKTSYRNKPTVDKLFGFTLSWMMNRKHESIIDLNLFYIFVNIEQESNKFRFFIVPSKIVAIYVKTQHEFWLRNRPNIEREDDDKISMRSFRIGLKEDNYPIPTPLAKDYENNWDFRENDKV